MVEIPVIEADGLARVIIEETPDGRVDIGYVAFDADGVPDVEEGFQVSAEIAKAIGEALLSLHRQMSGTGTNNIVDIRPAKVPIKVS